MLWTYPCTVKECENALSRGYIQSTTQEKISVDKEAAVLNNYLRARFRYLDAQQPWEFDANARKEMRDLEATLFLRMSLPQQGALDARLLGDEGMLLSIDVHGEKYSIADELRLKDGDSVELPLRVLVHGPYLLQHTLRAVLHVAPKATDHTKQMLTTLYPGILLSALPAAENQEPRMRSA